MTVDEIVQAITDSNVAITDRDVTRITEAAQRAALPKRFTCDCGTPYFLRGLSFYLTDGTEEREEARAIVCPRCHTVYVFGSSVSDGHPAWQKLER